MKIDKRAHLWELRAIAKRHPFDWWFAAWCYSDSLRHECGGGRW